MIQFLFLLVGCGAPEIDDDDGSTPIVEDTGYEVEEPASCDDVALKINGLDQDELEPPQVGDSWEVYLWCDAALLLGPSVLRFDPPDFASIEDNIATFIRAGTATMSMAVGGESAEMEVVVVDP